MQMIAVLIHKIIFKVDLALQQGLLSWRLRIHPFTGRMLYIVPITLIAWGADSLLPRLDWVWADLIVRSAIVGLALLASLLVLRITPELMTMLEGKLPARFTRPRS